MTSGGSLINEAFSLYVRLVTERALAITQGRRRRHERLLALSVRAWGRYVRRRSVISQASYPSCVIGFALTETADGVAAECLSCFEVLRFGERAWPGPMATSLLQHKLNGCMTRTRYGVTLEEWDPQRESWREYESRVSFSI